MSVPESGKGFWKNIKTTGEENSENTVENNQENSEGLVEDQVQGTEEKINTPSNPTLASGSLTGITAANAKIAAGAKGHYKKLNEEARLDLFGDRSNWDKVGYSEQTNLDLATKTFFGTLTNIGAGVIEGVASNDLVGIFNMAFENTEANYGNVLHDFANYVMEKTQENFHIYDGGSNSPFSFEYWGTQLQNTGYSTGIILEMFAEQALIAAATKGSGNAASAANLASRFNRLRKIPKFLSNSVVFGSYQGIKEAYLNGLQTGEETYRKYVDIGFSEQDAKKRANEAATLGFRMEALPLMALNAIQLGAITKYNPFLKKEASLGFSGGFEALSDSAFKGIKNKYLRKVADYATQAVSEGIEEGIQTGISKEAQYQVGLADGIVGQKHIEDRLFDDDEMRDSIIGGALGGTMFRFIGKRLTKLTKGAKIAQQEADYDSFLKNSAARVNSDLNDLKEAFESGEQDKVDVVRKRMQRNNVFEALSLDLMNQKESAFDSYISTLSEIKDAIDSNDSEKLKSFKLENVEDFTYIKDNYQTFVDDAFNIKEKLINNLEYTDDFNAAINITNNEKILEELSEFENRSNSIINNFKNDSQFSKLSSKGKEHLMATIEYGALAAKIEQGLATPVQKERLKELGTQIKEIKASTEVKDVLADKKILPTLNTQGIVKEYLNILEMQQYSDIISDKLAYWKNPENQKKERIKAAKKKVKEAKSKEDLEQAKENLKKEDNLTEEVEEIINDKIEKEKIKDISNPNEENKNFTSSNDKIKDNTVDINTERTVLAGDIVNNITKEEDFSYLEEDELFEPASTENITDKQREMLKTSVGDFYESLKSEVNREIGFEEFVRDFIKHNSKSATDRIYNALIEGWKANKYKEADYNKVYNNIFKDRKEISIDILNIAEDIIDGPKNKQEIVDSNQKDLEKVAENKSPIIDIDENNKPKLKDISDFRTSVPDLKASYLSLPYKREFVETEDGETLIVDIDTSSELNVSEDIDSNKILNPELVNPGTVLSVKIPIHYQNIKISTWEDEITKGPSMTFGEWEKLNNVEQYVNGKLNPEWVNKVPMIAYDKNGDGLFFIHDTQWYNMVNVGFKDDLQKQNEIITEARQNLNELRKNVIENESFNIEITDKRPGTWKQISKEQSPLTLNEANPDIQLALANDQGELLLNGEEIFEKDNKTLINKKEFSRGHIYDIRKSTVNNEYIAFEVLRDKVNNETVTTLKAVTKAYMFQYDENNSVSDNKTNKNIRNQILNITGLDIFDRADFENYINLFVPTIKGKFSNVSDIIASVESNKAIKNGSPFIAIQKGNLVFGVKGKNISGNNKALYIHPKKMNDNNGPKQLVSMLSKFEEILPNITQHISKKGLIENRDTVIIDEENNLIPSINYHQYLKNTLKTSIKSFNVGTKDKPTYATIIQPVVNFKIADNQEKVIETVKNKIETNKPLSNTEKVVFQENEKEITEKAEETKKELNEDDETKKALSDAFSALKELGVSEDDDTMQYLKDELGEDFEPNSQEDLDSDVEKVSNFLQTLNLTKEQEKERLIDFIEKNNLVIPESFSLDEKYKIAEGGEQQVFKLPNSNKVIKLNQAGNYKTWKNYFESLKLHNRLFPSTKYSLVGFALIGEDLTVALEQDFIKSDANTSSVEVQKYLKDKGFILNSIEEFDDNNFYQTYLSKDGTTFLTDINNDNVYTKEGKLHFIDTIIERNTDENLFEPISDEDIKNLKEDLTGTEGLSIIQDFQIVDYVFNQLSSNIDFKYKTSITKETLLEDIKKSYLELIEPKKIKNEKILKNLEDLYEKSSNSKLKPVIDKLSNEVKIFDTIKGNWSTIENKALEKLYKYTGIKEVTETTQIEDASSEVEKNYSKTSLEENGKSTSSYRLKRFFAGINQTKIDGQIKTGFLGIPTYVGFDTVYSTIEQIISSPYEVDSNFDLMIKRLEENVDNYKWLRQVIDNLKDAEDQIKNEFLYNFTRHTLSMKFTMFSKNRDNSWTLKAYDTNANEITRVIRRQWESGFKQSKLVFVEDGQYKINKERAKYLLETFNNWGTEVKSNNRKEEKKINVTNTELQTWLKDFGILLSNETINELRQKKTTYMTNDGKVTIPFDKMFNKSSNTAGIFGLMANYLENIIQKNDTNFEENPDNHPFNNANNILKTLSKIESKYSLYATTNSFRDGQKSIYGFTPTKHATDTVKSLKFDQNFRDQLGNKSFNKHSYILNLLNNNESFREKFYIDHLGITALKELNKKVFGDNSITSLSDSDHELTKLGLFQDIEQGDIKGTLGDNNFVNFRMARMFLPTMSDKSQMLDLYTAVLDLKSKHFNISEKGEITLTSQLKDILYSQLVKPELERITNFVSTIKKTDIKGYDLAAQMFLFIPELNNLIDTSNGQRVISLMINDPVNFNMAWFEENFKNKAQNILSEVIKENVENKIQQWKNNDFIISDKNSKVKSIQFMNKKYFNKFNGDFNAKVEYAANDYVINSLITNMNSYMLLAGDLAMYSQDKIKKYFQNGKPYLPKEDIGDNAYAKISKEIIGVNVGKRLALMLAPGNKLAKSKDSEYTQIFLKDYIDISSNIPTLVKLFYPDANIDSVSNSISEYNETSDSTKRKEIVEKLTKKYPQIADYLDIEATDAQEYTTTSEHINVLWGQGRLTDEQYDTIKSKIENQYQEESDGKSISKGNLLSFSELKLVLQPIKPVHTGFKNEERFDAMRMMYVKSSSFPLIPQVTKGTELDGLRKLLESYEKEKGKLVRASYQTANKVGAVTNAIEPFDAKGRFNNKITSQDLEKASLTLSRDNFRIQQDVPFKSAKRKEDTVSLGTQTLKLLFGDGILDIKNFELDGEKISGKELHQKFNTTYSNYINLKKKSLLENLGVDKEGNTIDPKNTVEKLQDLLKREAIDRGYPKQDVEALKLQPKYDSQGNIIDLQFSMPLWLSPNSNRYESLLNAIVTNRLVNIKLPGNSFVVGSEAGFKIQSDFNGINQSNIIFTNKWEGELKAAEIENGKLKKAQILIPSKLRDNEGNLISFIDENGNANPLYTERDENGVLRFKEDMIDENLLNITSFRIPTSGHVSMSQLEIVGILPTEVGDLMIVPKNLTKQKGLDFDVDKETTYQLHTYIEENGKIGVFSEKSRQDILKVADSKNTENLNDNSPESNLIKAIFGENPDFNINEIEEGTYLDKINTKLEQKLLENELVKIHSSVLSNPSSEVQTKINKVLSMDFAKSQAELIQNKIEGNFNQRNFTVLSDTYQKEKMYLGASGKLGIGVYSNYVVFHSMVQQSEEPITLLKTIGEGKTAPLKIAIGKQVSNGELGRKTSLAPKNIKRSIADIFSERQNTATDNEKEQIMGRVNINELTINVDSLMSALGFDKEKLEDGTEVSLPYLFLSQPIIKEYVELMKKTSSNTSDFNPNAKKEVLSKLYKKYKVLQQYDKKRVPYLMTGQTLFDNLTEPNKIIQTQVLETFELLDSYAQKVSTLQNTLNINNTGLGKSYFETVDKYEALRGFVEDYEVPLMGNNVLINNASKLIGDFKTNLDEVENPEEYINLNGLYIKPENPVGSMLVNSVQVGYNLWKDYFPYDDDYIGFATHQIMELLPNPPKSRSKIIEKRQEIFKEFKKYLVSSQKLGLFEGNPQSERARLFIDTESNKSLANYLKEILSSDNKQIEILKSNKLLSRLEFQIEANGLPSLIKFDNTKGENFDEDYLYLSLLELMDQNKKLPDLNGAEYSTRELAKDLISYTYLEGGIQEAIQFTKYIPISYLDYLPFSGIAREWNSKYRKDIFKAILGTSSTDITRFGRQYLQHNPQNLYKIDQKNLGKIKDGKYSGETDFLTDLESFTLDPQGFSSIDEYMVVNDLKFLTIYNPEIKKGYKKFQLYEKDGDTYKRISVLGAFGLSEYSIREDDIKSIVNDYYKTDKTSKIITTSEVNNEITDIFNLKNGKLEDIIENISNYNFTKYTHLKGIAKAILPYLDNNTKIHIEDILNSQGQRVARGKFKSRENLIVVDKQYFTKSNPEDLAKTILHEFIHSLTSNYIRKYVDNQGNFIDNNPPLEIQKLVVLFNETKKKLGVEIDKYKEKRTKQLAGETNEATTERERTVAYGGTNIREFVTLVMTEPNFQKEMSEVTYKATDKSLFQKFTELIDGLLKKILGQNYKANSITAEGINTTLEIIQKQAENNGTTSNLQKMKKNDASAEYTLNKGTVGIREINMDHIIDSYKNLEDNQEDSIFDFNPFECN